MKSGRYSHTQMMAILRTLEDSVPLGELYLEHGMCRASFYKRRAKFRDIVDSLISTITVWLG